MTTTHKKGLAALVLATLLFSLYGVFLRWIGVEFGVFSLSWIRSLIIVSTFVLYILGKRNWKPVRKTDYKWFVFMSFPGVLAFITYFVAVNHLTLATTLLIAYASFTISGYMLGYVLFKEKPTAVKLVSLLLCLIGVALIYTISFRQKDVFYATLAVVSGLGSAAWFIFSKKLSSKYPLVEILSIDFSIMFFLTLPLAVVLQESSPRLSFSLQWLGVFVLVFATISATLLSVYGFRHLQAQVATLVLLMEIIFASLIGWAFYQEVLTGFALAGGALILLGVTLPNLSVRKKGDSDLKH